MFKKLKKWFTAEDKDSISSMYEDENEYNKASQQLDNFDKEYFERVNAGESCQQFLSLGGQQDCALIQSLLYAEGIPSYIENQNINRIYGASTTAAVSAFAIKLFILSADYDDAYKIVTEYCNSQKMQAESKDDEAITVSEGISIVTGLIFAVIPPNVKQKGMGITILPKIKDASIPDSNL